MVKLKGFNHFAKRDRLFIRKKKMKQTICDLCKKEISGWTPDPRSRLILRSKDKGLDHRYDLCKKCINKVSMIVSDHLFIDEERK